MRLTHLFESDLEDSKQYVRKIESMSNGRNPMGRGVLFNMNDEGVNAYVLVELVAKEGFVHISEIHVLEALTGKGFGDYVMKLLVKEADHMGITLTLFAVPLKGAGKSIPKNKLKSFYKSFGFISEGGDRMVREPK